MNNLNSKKLSFVTVTYEGELPLLALNARSLARFVPADIVEDILIFVNDVEEERVIDKIARDYIGEYGVLASKVRVLSSNTVFLEKSQGWYASLLDFLARHPRCRFRKKQGGWSGNKGWVMQQAFKLCSARVARGQHIVMLDSKNVFIQPQNLNSFVDDKGRARASFIPLGKLHKRWLPPSCKALKLDYSEDLFRETTQYTTPFVVATEILRQLLSQFEKIHGPLHGVFARRFIKPTEFMLINAFCQKNLGGIRNVFAEDLVQASSFFTGSTTATIDRILDEAEQGRVAIMGLHVAVMGRLDDRQRSRLNNILAMNQITDGNFDMNNFYAVLKDNNSQRIQGSEKRLQKRNSR